MRMVFRAHPLSVARQIAAHSRNKYQRFLPADTDRNLEIRSIFMKRNGLHAHGFSGSAPKGRKTDSEVLPCAIVHYA